MPEESNLVEKADLLVGTRPLADPLRMIMIVGYSLAILLVFLGLALSVTSANWAFALIYSGQACTLLGLTLMIAPHGKPNAIYLRAFRTDKSTAQLRVEIAAILGTQFRLSGIRPPRKKTSMFLRFLVPGFMAIRYAGSKFMELEAGDDWMARLWETYKTTRIVFIDVRDMTPYVHEEIQMTFEAMGTARSVFVVDGGKSESEWRAALVAIVGVGCDPGELQFLDVSPEHVRSRQMESDLKQILKRLPAGVPGEQERGRQFVLDHVSSEALEQSRRKSPMTVILAIVALTISNVGSWALLKLIQADGSGPVVLTSRVLPLLAGLLFLIVFVVLGIYRGAVRARGLFRADHGGAAARAWFGLLGAVVLVFGVPVTTSALIIPTLMNLKTHANEISALQTIRVIGLTEMSYSDTYPEKGFACMLTTLGGDPGSGPPSAEAAQLLEPALTATGQKAGYRFKVTNCTKTMVNNHDMYTSYQVFATPLELGRTGNRGFCSDERGSIMVDPNGGTNCTEPLQ